MLRVSSLTRFLPVRTHDLLAVTVLGDDGLAVGVKAGSEAPAAAAAHLEVIDAGLLVDDDHRFSQEIHRLLDLDIESVLCHNDCND